MTGRYVTPTPEELGDMADNAQRADANYARTIRAAARMMDEWSWEDAFDAPVVIDLRDATEAEQTPTTKESTL